MTKDEFVKNFQNNLWGLNDNPNMTTHLNFNKKEARELANAFLKTMEDAFSQDDFTELSFVGFGTFKAKTTAERVGRNPKTGEEVKIKPKKTVKFRVGKKVDEKLNPPVIEIPVKKTAKKTPKTK